MPVARRIRDVLGAKASAAFAGREAELRCLADWAHSREPVAITWIHGLAGIGKTALWREFAARTRANVIALDCRFVEPTPEGFLLGLSSALHRPLAHVEAAAEAVRHSLLVLDSYESFRQLDGWLRQVFLPVLPETARVLICGRYAPAPHWRAALEWQGLIRVLPLPPLTKPESFTLMERAGASPSQAEAAYRLAQGHPMSLVLACGAQGDFTYGAPTHPTLPG